jgi:hypothetical protein
VVHVSLDGLGAKYLQFYVTNAPAQFPNFNRLITNGASTFNARCDYDFSEPVPNHISMFTARPVSQTAGQANTLHPSHNPSTLKALYPFRCRHLASALARPLRPFAVG